MSQREFFVVVDSVIALKEEVCCSLFTAAAGFSMKSGITEECSVPEGFARYVSTCTAFFFFQATAGGARSTFLTRCTPAAQWHSCKAG